MTRRERSLGERRRTRRSFRSSKRSLRGLLVLSVVSVPYGDCSVVGERSLRGLLSAADAGGRRSLGSRFTA